MAQAEYDKQLEITKLLMEGLNAIQVCIRDLWLVVSPNVSMWNIEHLVHDKSRTYLCDVKFRTFLCDSYQSCLLEISIHFVDFNSSELCTDARCYLSFSLSLHCLALISISYKCPWQTLQAYHWLIYICLINIVVSLKGLYTIITNVLTACSKIILDCKIWLVLLNV